MKRSVPFVACALLLLVLWQAHGGFVRYIDHRTGSAAMPLSQPLKSIPFTINGWTGREVELSPEIEKTAGADEYIRRDYFRSTTSGEATSAVALYMTYYGGLYRNIPHGPGTCYPMGGWANLDHNIEYGDSGRPLYHKYVFQKELDRHLVIYWYYVNGKRLAGASQTRLDFARNILKGSGGAIVQVQLAVTLNRDEPATEKAIQSFRQSIEPIVNKLLAEK